MHFCYNQTNRSGKISLAITRHTMGAKLLLNSSANILALIYNFACEITKLSWQHSVCLGANMTPKL